MHAYLYQITPMIRLGKGKDCDAVAVVRKFEFALNLLDQILTHSSAYLNDQTRDTLLEWLCEALEDIRDHKDELADPLQAEVLAVEHAVFASFQVARYNRQAKSAQEPPSIREAAKGAVEYWKAVARESEPPTPRAERIVTLLKLRYGW